MDQKLLLKEWELGDIIRGAVYLKRGTPKLEWMNLSERVDEKGRPIKERTNSLLGASSFLSALPSSSPQQSADRKVQPGNLHLDSL